MKNLWKIKIFSKTGNTQVWTFYPTLRPIYPLKMAKIGGNKILNKNLAIGLSESVNPNPVTLLPFKWKIGLLFALFEHFLLKKGVWSQFKGPESKSNLGYAGATIPGVLNMQRFWSHHMLVLSLQSQRSFFLIWDHFFKFGCFSMYHTHFFWKNEFDFLVQNLILSRLGPNSNFKTHE